MRRREFERLVARALESLPVPFQSRLDNVVVIVEDWPSPELLQDLEVDPDETLFGYYEGTPLTEYGRDAGAALPDRIYIYQGAIEEVCRTKAEIIEEVRKTVLHEVGHHFGLGEAELEHL